MIRMPKCEDLCFIFEAAESARMAFSTKAFAIAAALAAFAAPALAQAPATPWELNPDMMQTEWRPESLQLAQEIKSHAEKKGITAGQFAVAWVLNSAFVSSIVAGPRTEEQWDGYISALDYRFTSEDEALIDRLVTPGHPSTPGYNDPAYPIEGRRARTA